ncbi:MAG: hypothetical protein GW910_04570 [Candidatus Altiarchaeum hamiconexum]|uniref:ATPase domain-containing protein n=1 Tax=Candidatus Altarchaeum hamiconexum TaxID=1803513 RepID=A0A8J7YT89_9ARCH|nr:hypothetical protein [Candidatus Altarchaeum hamiconexum]NCT00838.1 hypothetical protein [Candidatus Altarchaeum hamiconexum]
MKTDGYLTYDVFNFFIRLTKELHICHVFAISSDSLFIEKVYNKAMLEGRANYTLIDDFDEETTKKFLKKHRFKKTDTAIKYFGGKPIDLIRLLSQNKDVEIFAREIINEKRRLLTDMLDELMYVQPKVEMRKKEIPVERNKVVEILEKFKDKEKIEDIKISRAEKIYLVGRNILFVDPGRNIIKPQSRTILVAIREILKEMKQ